ncbi:MAG: hypothetical protein EBQ92_11230, partial [Proteobacteria bacterium]|nr:hypothetical protein [Pseudomonadota bacterium]
IGLSRNIIGVCEENYSPIDAKRYKIKCQVLSDAWQMYATLYDYCVKVKDRLNGVISISDERVNIEKQIASLKASISILNSNLSSINILMKLSEDDKLKNFDEVKKSIYNISKAADNVQDRKIKDELVSSIDYLIELNKDRDLEKTIYGLRGAINSREHKLKQLEISLQNNIIDQKIMENDLQTLESNRFIELLDKIILEIESTRNENKENEIKSKLHKIAI